MKPFILEINANKELKPGCLLLSNPLLEDDPLVLLEEVEKEVIVLVQHDYEGSVGFNLTQHVQGIYVADVVEELHGYHPQLHLYKGGPCGEDLMYILHTDASMNQDSHPDLVGDTGVFWGANFSNSIEKINNHDYDPMKMKFLVGHHQWKVGELEQKVKKLEYFIKDATANDILSHKIKGMWDVIMKRSSGLCKISDPMKLN